MKTDFFITYHHDDELAARWIADVLLKVPYSLFMESWDFLPGGSPLEKIDYMLIRSCSAAVLVSERWLRAGVDAGTWQPVAHKYPGPGAPALLLLRIDSCDVTQALGAVAYTDLYGIKAGDAANRLLKAAGAVAPSAPVEEKKVTWPVTPATGPGILESRKKELDLLLAQTVKHHYHMTLDLETEVKKEVEVKDEKTGRIEKRKQWVWEAVPLERVLTDGNHYLLVNPSGMGKTTFLTFAAGVLLDRVKNYPFVPFLTTCTAINERSGSIGDLIAGQVESLYKNAQTGVVKEEWENLCILIDALDQARDVDDIVSSLLLPNQYTHYRKAKIILSSRQNTADKVREGFRKIRLKLPVDDEVRHYLGEENYTKLKGHIQASRELVTVPVLLEMLKTITAKGVEAPVLESRAGLYTEFTKILVDQERNKPRFWQDSAAVHHFIENELEQVLETIAFFSLAENKILEIEKETLVKYCGTLEKKEALLNIGILLELFEDREQKMVFRHQSFQAYFAARYMYYRRQDLFREMMKDIRFFYSDVWYEVMRFFVGMEKNSQRAGIIIDLISKKKPHENILLYLSKKFWEFNKLFYKMFSKPQWQNPNSNLSNHERVAEDDQNDFFKKSIQGVRKKSKTHDIIYALRLFFSVFLLSDAKIELKKVDNIYEQLRFLLTNERQYLQFVISNIDKFNPGKGELWRRFITTLVSLLYDEGDDLSRNAAIFLAKIVTNTDWPLLYHLHMDGNGYFNPDVIETFCKISKSEDIHLLEPLLKDKNINVRITAVEILGKIGTIEHIPLLEHILWDKTAWIHNYAAYALKRIGATTKDIPLLESQLSHKDKNVRRTAVEILHIIGKTNDIPLLEPLLKDEDEFVRKAVAKVLGKIGTSDHIHLLEPFFKGPYTNIPYSAVEALGNIGTARDIHFLIPLIRYSGGLDHSFIDALRKIVKVQDISLLEPLLTDKSDSVRKVAAYILGCIGTTTHIPLLKPLLWDKKSWVRETAAYALGKIGATTEDIPYLESQLSHKDKYVRRTAVRILNIIGKTDDIPLLEPLLKDEDEYVREVAVKTLGIIGTPKYISLLEPLLTDKYTDVCHAALKTLGKIGTAKDIPLLKPIFKRYLNLGHWFYESLCYTIEALGRIGTANNIHFLKPLFWDGNERVRCTAINALGNIGTTKHIFLLDILLRNENKSIRNTAAQTIEKILKRSTPKFPTSLVDPEKKRKVLRVKNISRYIPSRNTLLNILHISDIHYSEENDPSITRIFHEFLKDIKQWREQHHHEPIHAICLTGDIAFSGQKDQYASIHERINEILQVTGCAKDNLFIIPGNHDVHEFNNIPEECQQIMDKALKDETTIDRLLNDFEKYRPFHDKFTHYYGYVETSGFANSRTETRSGKPKPWYSRRLKDFPVRIIGLNSALFCLKPYSERDKIRMGKRQLEEAYFHEKALGTEDQELVLLLTHHPADWLRETEKDEYTALMDSYSMVHLHGHTHKLEIKEVRSLSGSTYMLIGTGSIYGEKGTKDINTYHIMTLDFEKQEIHIWGRRWEPGYGFWTVFADNARNVFPFPKKNP